VLAGVRRTSPFGRLPRTLPEAPVDSSSTENHENAPCPVCGSGAPRLRYRITRFRVLQCQRCELIYLSPMLDPQEVKEMFSRLYTEGEGSVPELKTYYDFCYRDEPDNPLVQLYETWLDELERHHPPGRLLDVGCGTGLFLAVARRRGWEPHGIDDCFEATQHARNHFGLDVSNGQFEDFRSRGEVFDAITGWDIIEHAREPLGLLEAMRSCLAPGGIIGLSTPNQKSILDVAAGAMYRASAGQVTWPLEKFYIEQHFLYYTPSTLTDSLARSGFEPLILRRELTDLRRLHLSAPMRIVLEGLFLAARVSGLENRIFVVAREASAAARAA